MVIDKIRVDASFNKQPDSSAHQLLILHCLCVTAEDLKSLEEENQKLRESALCKICLDKRADVIFLPCGHIVSCPQCAPALDSCPVCRKPVMGLVKAFFATRQERMDADDDDDV